MHITVLYQVLCLKWLQASPDQVFLMISLQILDSNHWWGTLFPQVVIKNWKPFFIAIQKFTTVEIIFKELKNSSFLFSLTDVNVENVFW